MKRIETGDERDVKMKFRFENIRNIFQNKRLKAAFQAVRYDMESIEENHAALKDSVNEWVIFLDEENRDLKRRVRELERKLDSMEIRREDDQLAFLKSM